MLKHRYRKLLNNKNISILKTNQHKSFLFNFAITIILTVSSKTPRGISYLYIQSKSLSESGNLFFFFASRMIKESQSMFEEWFFSFQLKDFSCCFNHFRHHNLNVSRRQEHLFSCNYLNIIGYSSFGNHRLILRNKLNKWKMKNMTSKWLL